LRTHDDPVRTTRFPEPPFPLFRTRRTAGLNEETRL
jgi:hypothetical protein